MIMSCDFHALIESSGFILGSISIVVFVGFMLYILIFPIIKLIIGIFCKRISIKRVGKDMLQGILAAICIIIGMLILIYGLGWICCHIGLTQFLYDHKFIGI